jgi:Putative zinc-finger
VTCERAHLDGAYVLGALSPSERLEFERHLAQCAECSRSVRELAGLPGLLAQVRVADLEASAVPPLPDTILPSLLREVRGAQRRRSVVVAAVAAAVAAAVVGGLAVAAGLDDDSDQVTAAKPTATTSTTTASSQPMVATGQSPIQADLVVAGVAWGTRIDLTCSYAANGEDYQGSSAPKYALVVRTRDGGTEQVATWRALPGRTMRLSAATATTRSDISAVEMWTASGRVIARLTV